MGAFVFERRVTMETGIVRRIDELGRVVIPKEVRRAHSIKEGDPMEIFSIEGGILLKKYETSEMKLKSLLEQLRDAATTEYYMDSKQSGILKAIDDLRDML
jgi:AbrB family looped-hinge helix DNA binding protein